MPVVLVPRVEDVAQVGDAMGADECAAVQDAGRVLQALRDLDAVKRGDVSGADAWEYANDKNMFTQWAPKSGITAEAPAPPAAGAPPKKAA